MDTIQEEEFQVGESSQATIVAPISDEITQKIFKAMEEQSDALKKMGSCLTKLEDAKLKESTCVEVLDEEEVADWMKGTKLIMKEQAIWETHGRNYSHEREDGENATSLSQSPRNGWLSL